MSLFPSAKSIPSCSVSYGMVDAGIFLQEGKEINFVSFDRAREIIENMPESARNTLLAPVLQGLIDDQSVFYLIDDSNDGGQLAISVEDFKELASKHSNRPTGNCEELSVENIAQKAGELSSVPKHADNPSADHQPQITNEKTVPPNLMAAFRNIKVQPSMACNKAFKEIRPAPPHDKDGEEGEYVNCKRRFSRDVLLPFWRHRSKYSRCIIILAVLFLIGIVIAGALAPVFWPKETEPPATTVSPIIPTTSKYLPPEEYIARCLRAICFWATKCEEETAVSYSKDGYERGCKKDGTSEGCGWYLMHELYFKDCFQKDPGIISDWRDCARDYNCSTRCVHQYYRRYEQRCPEKMVECECLTRIHVGGPSGYNKSSTLVNWESIKAILDGM